MTTHSRIAAFLSTSALCLGLAAAPSAFAAGASKTGDTKTQADGNAEKNEGRIQNAVGGMKDSVREAVGKK